MNLFASNKAFASSNLAALINYIATLSTMRLTGQMFSMGVALLIISIFIGKSTITIESKNALLSGIGIAFILFTILCFAGIFASMARGRIRE
jgi:hypothetical protein